MSDDLQPLNDAPLLPPSDHSAYDLKSSSKASLPIYLGIALLAAGGLGYLGYRSVKNRDLRKKHAAYIEQFATIEKDDVGPFWVCLFGPNTDPGMFSDNLMLGKRVEASFAMDPLHFPDKVLDECAPRLKGVGTKALNIDGPEEYREPAEKYAKSLDGLAEGISAWAAKAKTRSGAREIERKVQAAGTAYHAVDGKPTPEALAYDRFLRCVLPDLDKVPDMQTVLQTLFEECKKPDFVATKVHNECGKAVTQTDGLTEDKTFTVTFQKLGSDDRDFQAWDACFKRSRKDQKQSEMEDFGKAWKEYMDQSGAVRKVGADALKND